MNLKILFMLMGYYAIISLLFSLGGDTLTGYSVNATFNNSGLQAEEIDSGGFFSTGVSILRFAGFVGFGIGLPEDTPSWFSASFILWQSMITLLTIGFVIKSIWDG